jgi:hypothetical protein
VTADRYTECPTFSDLGFEARRGGRGDKALPSVRLNMWERQHIITVALCDRLETAVQGFRMRVDGGGLGDSPGLAFECRQVLGHLVETLAAELEAFDELCGLDEADLVPS